MVRFLQQSSDPAGKNIVFIMLTTNCVWDGNSQTEQDNDDELDYNDLWEPWKNIIVSLKTATANIPTCKRLLDVKTNTLSLTT